MPFLPPNQQCQSTEGESVQYTRPQLRCTIAPVSCMTKTYYFRCSLNQMSFPVLGTVVRAFQKGPWPVPTVHKCSHPKHEQEGLVGQLANPHLSGKQPLTQRLLRRHSFPEPLHVLPFICAILVSSPWGVQLNVEKSGRAGYEMSYSRPTHRSDMVQQFGHQTCNKEIMGLISG